MGAVLAGGHGLRLAEQGTAFRAHLDVAFELTISRDLPRSGYITFLNAVFLASFQFVFLSIVVIHTIYRLQTLRQPEKAATLHRLGRWIYPGAYFGVLVLLVIGFLG